MPGRYRLFRAAKSVVLLPEPVGPVTRMMPVGDWSSRCRPVVTGAARPSASTDCGSPWGSRIRMVAFSP